MLAFKDLLLGKIIPFCAHKISYLYYAFKDRVKLKREPKIKVFFTAHLTN